MNLFGMANSDEIVDWVKGQGVTPLFLMVSGSHANGLARPDSDLDIRGIYASPIRKLLSLAPGSDTIEAKEILGGQVDLQLYELGKAFRMLLLHNGNVVHMLLAPTCFLRSRFKWTDLANRFLTRRLANYFAGYHQSQKRRAAVNRGGKSLLYTYREVLSGILLMRTGKWIFDFQELKSTFEETYSWHSSLLDAFMDREDWKKPVPMDRLDRFDAEWAKLLDLLDEEKATSPLPETYDGHDELNRMLLDYRLDEFMRTKW